MSQPLTFDDYLDWLVTNQEFFAKRIEKKPPPPKHPGIVLSQAYLKPRGINQSKLARMIGCTHAKVNEVIHGKRAVTPDFALTLERVLGDPAEHWLSLQANYDLWLLRQKKS